MAELKTLIDTITIQAGQADADFKARVPLSTQASLEKIRDVVFSDKSLYNKFLTTLVDRIALTMVKNNSFVNPLKKFKTGGIAYGVKIQDLIVNPGIAETYNMGLSKDDRQNFFAPKIPDVKACYYSALREDVYKVTIYKKMVRRAFTDPGAMMDLINQILSSLKDGDEKDEFKLMKNTLGIAVMNGHMNYEIVKGNNDVEIGKSLIKRAKIMSAKFELPSDHNNAWSKVEPGKYVNTQVKKANQTLLINLDVACTIDVDIAAYVYNLSKITSIEPGQVILVDDFGNCPAYAMLIDNYFLKVKEVNLNTDDDFVVDGQYTNFFRFHDQIYSYCPFANAIAFMPEGFNIGGGSPSGEEGGGGSPSGEEGGGSTV